MASLGDATTLSRSALLKRLSDAIDPRGLDLEEEKAWAKQNPQEFKRRIDFIKITVEPYFKQLPPFWKTTFCASTLPGNKCCRYRAACKFAHSIAAQQALSDLFTEPSVTDNVEDQYRVLHHLGLS